jgi:uncharacterized protein YuzB (UPF0349 family)
MRPIIEFCTNNMHHGTEKVMKSLELDKAFDVIEYGCLGNCGQCLSEPFALVNGTIVEALTTEELKAKIHVQIEQEIAMWNLNSED